MLISNHEKYLRGMTLLIFVFGFLLSPAQGLADEPPTCISQDVCTEGGFLKPEFIGTPCGEEFELSCAQIGIATTQEKLNLCEKISGNFQSLSKRRQRKIRALFRLLRAIQGGKVRCKKTQAGIICERG